MLGQGGLSILSRMATNAELKLLRLLRSAHGRAKSKLFAAEGLRMCLSLLEAGAEPQKLFAVRESVGMLPAGIPLEVVTPGWLEQASALSSQAGVIGIFCAPPARDFSYQGTFTLALDCIQNPGNLGTLARTADWFGVSQLLCSPACADLYAPKALQATMGAIAKIRARYEPLEPSIDALPRDFPVIALDMGGSSFASWEPPREGILLVGSEGRGLAPALLQRATQVISIPCVGQPATDSLNVAVATAVVLARIRNE